MDPYHQLLHWIAHAIGHHLGDETPHWVHPVLHVVLIWAPLGLTVLVLTRLARFLLERYRRRGRAVKQRDHQVSILPDTSIRFILRYSRAAQFGLIAAGLLSMPVLYVTLELPKTIINNALAEEHLPQEYFGQVISQVSYLFILCAAYFAAIAVSGALKFYINLFKGRVGERLLRRLRLTLFSLWRAGAGSPQRTEVIPLITQEVEPIGGFAADAFALPVFQGGTFLTILVFMFAQDPILGAAAITLLPLQLALIPRLQRKINRLARHRVHEIRSLSGRLGEQAVSETLSLSGLNSVASALKRIETIRLEIHRSKFFMKSLNNFLTALTPFFFYAVGGYLVIEDRLTLGALVAVLAAYKDFSAPLRELFRYYQTVEDVRIRYDEVRRFIS